MWWLFIAWLIGVFICSEILTTEHAKLRLIPRNRPIARFFVGAILVVFWPIFFAPNIYRFCKHLEEFSKELRDKK